MRSNADSRQVRVAIAQSEPIYLDSGASLAKALRLIEQAKQHDAGLVAFGEAWIPGYPAWLDICPDAAFWDHKPTKQLFARLRENSIVVSGPEVATLCKIAGDLKITVVIGINERVDEGPGNGTLYNTILTFTPEGKLGNHHQQPSSYILREDDLGERRLWWPDLGEDWGHSRRKSNLLGALDAAGTDGHAQFWGGHPCGSLADGA
jgi:Carbon-nitrogen hydrolase